MKVGREWSLLGETIEVSAVLIRIAICLVAGVLGVVLQSSTQRCTSLCEANSSYLESAMLQLTRLDQVERQNSSDRPEKEVKRTTRKLVGWTIHIDQQLQRTSPKELKTALALLRKQLETIKERVPAKAVAELQKVPLYFSSPYDGVAPRAEFHPGAEWLKDNGRDPEMVRAVEFTNISIFEQEVDRMPMFVLHELAHAYHFRVLEGGFENEKIRHAWERARAAKTYERVERRLGRGLDTVFEPAYGISNPQEYFAETTEAYFGENDFYPFNRKQLRQHDPEMELLLRELWGAPEP